MNKPDSNKVKALIHSIGLKYNLRDIEITDVVNSPYKFTKEVLNELNIDSTTTEEEFENIKTNFIYMYIGKMYASYGLYNAHRNNLKNKENGSSRQKSWEIKESEQNISD